MRSKSMIYKKIRELRHIVETSEDTIVKRLAYEMKSVLIWTLQNGKGTMVGKWRKEVLQSALILKTRLVEDMKADLKELEENETRSTP